MFANCYTPFAYLLIDNRALAGVVSQCAGGVVRCSRSTSVNRCWPRSDITSSPHSTSAKTEKSSLPSSPGQFRRLLVPRLFHLLSSLHCHTLVNQFIVQKICQLTFFHTGFDEARCRTARHHAVLRLRKGDTSMGPIPREDPREELVPWNISLTASDFV